MLKSNFRSAISALAFAAACCAWSSGASAATAIDNLGNGPAASPSTSSLSPDAQPYSSLFPAEGEDISAFIARASANAVSAAPERSTALKVLLGLAGLALLLRRQAWWRKAAYMRFNQRDNVLSDRN
jgi:hypothetical protein